MEIQETPLVPSSRHNNSYTDRTDPELVSMCLNGDVAAWEALVRRYRRLIYSVPRRFGFNKQDSADVFQSVCLKLIENLHHLKDDTRLGGWLVITSSRTCLNLMASRQREPDTVGLEFDDRLDPERNVEELRLYVEEQQEIRDSVNELPGRCRALIDMLYLDANSPSYQEISEIIGMPLGSIGSNRARCLEKLRKIIRDRGIK